MLLLCFNVFDKLYFVSVFTENGKDNYYISTLVLTINRNCVKQLVEAKEMKLHSTNGKDISFLVINFGGLRHFTTK